MSKQASQSFDLLEDRIRRWIWQEQWNELHEVQEQAIPAILGTDHDVIIAAQTAAGKTEAAFFPILTRLLQHAEGSGSDAGLCVYVSPLKALINDQFSRLLRLCETLDIPVWPWHGDISASLKNRFYKRPGGILLITPESLEAMLCNRGFQVGAIFARLDYFVIDELHAFIGTERGKQLQSLLHRIDAVIGKKVPRIGLSATLGDMSLAADFLRPHAGPAVQVINAQNHNGEIRILLKAYEDIAPRQATFEAQPDTPKMVESQSESAITGHLFQTLLDSNNLVFPNSRAKVEQYTWRLQQLCANANIPNQFWPHHGSLAKELREETESALKNREQHTTAICTNTLELGIDIGTVKSIAQIGSPPSVASLRQRLGRSGRRNGESAILRGYVIEWELTDQSNLLVQLREGLVEFAAMISLLLDKWFEPPQPNGLHLSTLVQQLLALIAQKGGISAIDAWQILCCNGPFGNVQKNEFLDLLRHLGQAQLLQQEASGLLLHGAKSEPLVNHYTFYAAFASEEEFRIVTRNRTLGSIPVNNAISVGDLILFAAKTWRIEQIDEENKTIFVAQTHAGRAPAFNGGSGQLHDRVRQRMRELYQGTDTPFFLDNTATRLLAQGRQTYQRHALERQTLLQLGNNILLFTWLGDKVNAALVAMLKLKGLTAMQAGPAIEIMMPRLSKREIIEHLLSLAHNAPPSPDMLLQDARNCCQEKWDWALPEGLLKKSFASLHLDIAGAHQWLLANSHTLQEV